VVDRLTGDAAGFVDVLASLDFPMFALTTVAADDGERSGCMIGFATQCSIDPPRFLACISVENHTARVALRAHALALHVIPLDQLDLAKLFGQETGDAVDKFSRCAWSPGPDGVPLLDACPTRFVGRIVERVALGDHTGYVVDPVLADGPAPGPGDYVRFQDVRDLDPGHPA
jgi:flavin reductase (DIM6/NTAB) family NADH-FMN oxidoreductase RutF